MITVLTKRATAEELKNASEDLDGYIKFVVDIHRNIMTTGGTRHVQGEELLLSQGSKQSDLWGGGVDMETKDIDYDSMINIRPLQNNYGREVISESVRAKMKDLVMQFLL